MSLDSIGIKYEAACRLMAVGGYCNIGGYYIAMCKSEVMDIARQNYIEVIQPFGDNPEGLARESII